MMNEEYNVIHFWYSLLLQHAMTSPCQFSQQSLFASFWRQSHVVASIRIVFCAPFTSSARHCCSSQVNYAHPVVKRQSTEQEYHLYNCWWLVQSRAGIATYVETVVLNLNQSPHSAARADSDSAGDHSSQSSKQPPHIRASEK